MATTEFRLHATFKANSREFRIARLLLNGSTREEVMRELAPLVGSDRRYTYYENRNRRGRPSPGIDSTPKPLVEQFRLFIWTVDKTIKEMENAGWINPETRNERKRWSSKEQTYVKFRSRFAQELMRLAEQEQL